ncbi:MAG TPA: amino acid adenylation domain-containing protein [Steroidobacteraceae bacterium]|nr:amino acid adenylation domain-containing protein [Steroidobacteraceae bacterium]
MTVTRGGCLAAFEAQAARTPAAIAIVSEGRATDYAQLNGQANALAQRLVALGARRGRFVGVHLERSPAMVVAVLATLKSGAAYVPLDPAYPAARLRTMLDDSTPCIILTRSTDAAALPPHAAQVLRMDRDTDLGSAGAAPAQIPPTDMDVAYLMYTSGSSGTPKGVLVTHGGVRNYLEWRSSYFPLTAADRCLQKASLSFDDSVWEMLEPLSTGARLILARPRFEYDTAYLVALMRQEQVTAACFVPSLLRALVEEPGADACHTLRRLTTGGETLTMALQRRVRDRFSSATLYNGYGTTETTIASTFWRCIDEPHARAVPIGHPIANTQVHLLDAALGPVPRGEPGEICIGGAGLAQGYLNRAALTAERFIGHPLAGPGGRLYRTGDLGCLRADGALEFLGRIDEQVKVNGVRVELGDIEAALLDHPAVKAAAVVCREAAGRTMLAAFIVPRGPVLPGRTEIRTFLRDRLPATMIPGRFAFLPALPMTPSGKLDRNALRGLPADPAEEHAAVAPRDEREAHLQRLWEGLLEARPIGVQDDFFALGGNSLLAVKLVAGINEVLGTRLSAEVLFETSTIESLARRLAEQAGAGGAGSCDADIIVPLAPDTGGIPLFLVHQIDGEIARYRLLAQHLRGRVPVHGIRAPEDPPLDDIGTMARRYVEAIRARHPRGPYALGGHSSGGLIAFEMARLLRSQGEPVSLLALIDVDAAMYRRRSLLDGLRFHHDRFRSLPPAYRRVYLWRNLARFGRAILSRAQGKGEPADDAGLPHGPVRAAMERAVGRYRPTRYEGPIVLFRATDRTISGTYGRTLGWKRLSHAPIRVIDVPGNHLTLLQGDGTEELAEHLQQYL